MGPPPRPLRRLIVGVAFGACAIVTACWCGAMAAGMPMAGGWTMSMAWMRMPGQSWLGAAIAFVAMWSVMMAAMMVPAIAPVLTRHRRPLRVAGAYFAAWAMVGAAIYPIGVAIAAAEMRWAGVARAVPMLAGVVVVIMGIAQLGRWKARVLLRARDRACCAPRRRPGPMQAWRDGWRLGKRCVRCCAPTTLILLAVGVMNLGAMIAVGAAIALERLAPQPERIARAIGMVAIVVGVVAIARAVA